MFARPSGWRHQTEDPRGQCGPWQPWRPGQDSPPHTQPEQGGAGRHCAERGDSGTAVRGTRDCGQHVVQHGEMSRWDQVSMLCRMVRFLGETRWAGCAAWWDVQVRERELLLATLSNDGLGTIRLKFQMLLYYLICSETFHLNFTKQLYYNLLGISRFLPISRIHKNRLTRKFSPTWHFFLSSGNTVLCCIIAALYPDILSKMRREVEENGLMVEDEYILGRLSLQKVQSLRYVSQVIKEVLRLWPPIGGGYRKVIKTFTLNVRSCLYSQQVACEKLLRDHVILRHIRTMDV